LTRPISLKQGPRHESWLLADDSDEIITCDAGSMIPHRLLNENFKPLRPRITDIIYPQYSAETGVEIQEVSPARSSLHLLRSHVNARNLHGHGVHEMASIVRQCRSYALRYGSFADLQRIFSSGSGLFA